MENEFYNGYQVGFLNEQIDFPIYDAYKDQIATVKDTPDNVAKYVNYSLVLSSKRGFPIFTASNISGKEFQKAARKDNWRKDKRIDESCQWGKELYKAPKSDFDKGHMTKREDVQWGKNEDIAMLAADSTFYYTNAVPQHANLNQKIWRRLEDYILHTETRENGLKIAVFTGPVLYDKDPEFVTEVNGKKVKLPVLFWKIVYFKKKDGSLFRTGFMMSQNTLLQQHGIIEDKMSFESANESDIFMQFDDADVYQVNVRTIETLTKLDFTKANEPFIDDRKIKLIIEEIDVHESFSESADPYQEIGFKINVAL